MVWARAAKVLAPGRFRSVKISYGLGFSENRGPEYSTLNSRILIIIIIRTPKYGTPNFPKISFRGPGIFDARDGHGIFVL